MGCTGSPFRGMIWVNLEEYIDILKKFGVEYDERYIFKPLE